MPSLLPPEMHDLIVDFLHDEPGALKACCLASKSWVHRTRQHLFANVKFSSESRVKLWEETFPDPLNSPARYTRSLSIRGSQLITFRGRGVPGGWIRAFSGIVRLHADFVGYAGGTVPLVPLRGLSPTLKSLHMVYWVIPPLSEIFGLMCTFPLLEDISLVSPGSNSEDGRWNIPLTSPRFTGRLGLDMVGGMRSVVRRLLELPSGLHFSKITMTYVDEDVESVMNLVSRCSDTLESLSIFYYGSATDSMRQLDLSKLTGLKEVVLMSGPNVRWITMTLQTAESTNLQRIIIHFPAPLRASDEELFHREWQDLDYALLQLWTSRSVRPRIEHGGGLSWCELRKLAPRLLPELTSRGVVDLVEYNVYTEGRRRGWPLHGGGESVDKYMLSFLN